MTTAPLSRNRDFNLIWVGQAASALGTRITALALPLLVLATGGSAAAVGLVSFASTAPYLLLQIPAGAIVDRHDRRRLMLWCDAIRLVALLSLPVAIWTDALTVAQLAVVGFVEGSGFVVFGLAEEAAVKNVVPDEQLEAAVGRNEARSRGAGLAGQPLGGLLFGVAGALPFVVDALTYLLSFVLLLFVRTPLQEERSAETAPASWAEAKAGIGYLWRQRFLRHCTLLVAGSNLIFQALFVLTVVVARERGASAAEVGALFGIVGALGLLGALVAPAIAERVSGRAVVVGLNWVWAAALPLYLLPVPPPALGAIFGVMSFAGACWNVVLGAAELRLVPDRLLGRVRGAAGLFAWGAVPLGGLLGGASLSALGADATVLAMTAGMVVLAVVATATITAEVVGVRGAAAGRAE